MTTEQHTQFVSEDEKKRVSIENLSKLTGFPAEIICSEIFNGQTPSEVSLEELRSAMLKFIDTSLLTQEN